MEKKQIKRWIKPDYCINKPLDCEKCEQFNKVYKSCSLITSHIKKGNEYD
jgi:hypothetical protein